eukprot:TRINITY_DN4629_c0_g2_i1.p1 TRINITY_DN4629_c0_g2~~TRINITY_DN4629_c0_g2_i1.p1  ORF type:complete len:107 (-),score=12.60 TRINITY_DN4629_c0_g2_i1:42-362(-)
MTTVTQQHNTEPTTLEETEKVIKGLNILRKGLEEEQKTLRQKILDNEKRIEDVDLQLTKLTKKLNGDFRNLYLLFYQFPQTFPILSYFTLFIFFASEKKKIVRSSF